MIDWKTKLCSRKFWACVAGFVTGLIVFIQHPTSDAQAVTALIMSAGSLVAYIIGEGWADAAGASNAVIVQDYDDDEDADDDVAEDE